MFNKYFYDSLLFFRNHFIALAAIILPIVVPLEFISMLVIQPRIDDPNSTGAILMPMLLDFLASPIYMVACIFYIDAIIRDEKRDVKSLWRAGIQNWFTYLVLSIMVGFVVAIGLLMFILPGIYFAVRFAFAQFELLFNRLNPPDAIRSSWRMTTEHQVVILIGFVVITIILYGPLILFSSAFSELIKANWIIGSLINMLYAVLTMLYTIFCFRVYDDARRQTGIPADNSTPGE